MESIFQIESLEAFRTVSAELLSNLYCLGGAHNTLLETDVFQKGQQEMRTLISDCNFERQKVVELLQNKEWHQEKLLCFQNIMEQNWANLLNAALNHYNSNYGETVVNFNWLLKFVLGTSELKTLKYPLLQLILSTISRVGQQNSVMYEINKDMLCKMINILENI